MTHSAASQTVTEAVVRAVIAAAAGAGRWYTGGMPDNCLAGQMRSAAAALIATLTDAQRERAIRPFTDDAARRWLEYRPRLRAGACLAGLSLDGRKAAHRLLSTALSDHAFAQAMAVIALEEVLDRREEGQHVA